MPAPHPAAPTLQITTVQPGFLRIETETDAAATWIEREAPQYGRLYYPTAGLPYYMLRVADSYDIDEVCRYFALREAR